MMTPCALGNFDAAPSAGARRLLGVSLHAGQHGVETHLTSSEPETVHDRANEVLGNRQRRLRWLIVDRAEQDAQERGDRRGLTRVYVGVEMKLPIPVFGEQVDSRL